MLTASSLKAGYLKYCQKMSDTGQGLLDAGRKDEFVEDSEIKNVWGMFLLSFTDFVYNKLTIHRHNHEDLPMVYAHAPPHGDEPCNQPRCHGEQFDSA